MINIEKYISSSFVSTNTLKRACLTLEDNKNEKKTHFYPDSLYASGFKTIQKCSQSLSQIKINRFKTTYIAI